MTTATEQGWAPASDVVAAEQSVLGAAVQYTRAAEVAAETVGPGDFHDPRHEAVFAAVLDLVDVGKPVDPTSVLGEVTRRGETTKIGGGAYLATLMERASVGESLQWHARHVAADALRRRVHSAGHRIVQIASGAGFDPETSVDEARQSLDGAVSTPGPAPVASAAALVDDVIDDIQNGVDVPGVPTPYIDLNRLLSSLAPGQLIVVGARPGAGKSTIGLDCARHVSVRLHRPSLYVSCEMPRGELMQRLLAAEARVTLTHIQNRSLDEYEWRRLGDARARLAEADGLVIDDAPEAGLAHIRARLRGMARTSPAELVIVDYLQLLSTPPSETRERAVASLSRGLKLIAREFDVPIVLAAQLNRSVEQRNDKRPHLSDLRESGAVEADADVVVLLHRESMYEPESPRAGELDLIVAKHRNGPTATITVAFQGHYGRCGDMAPAHSGANP